MTIIPPKLLHKSIVDDVLLTNPRKVIPSFFISAELQNEKAKVCEAIDNLYYFDEFHGNVFRCPSNDRNVTGLPFSAVIEKNINIFPRAVPHQVIEKFCDTEEPSFTTVATIDDDITSFLMLHKLRNRSTSFSFVNTGEHYFFYKKPHEHVPEIMLLEAARQAIYYQLYTYSGHELGKVTVSLSELNAKFYSYGELMYPIEVIIDDITEGEDEYPKEVHHSVSFYQRGALIAQIDSLAPVISLNRFKMARNACLFDSESFTPLHHAPIVALITSNNMAPVIVSLYEISKNSSVTNNYKGDDLSNIFLTVIYGESLCFHVPISLKYKDETNSIWQFDTVSYADMEILKEMVKRGFVVSETGSLQVI